MCLVSFKSNWGQGDDSVFRFLLHIWVFWHPMPAFSHPPECQSVVAWRSWGSTASLDPSIYKYTRTGLLLLFCDFRYLAPNINSLFVKFLVWGHTCLLRCHFLLYAHALLLVVLGRPNGMLGIEPGSSACNTSSPLHYCSGPTLITFS